MIAVYPSPSAPTWPSPAGSACSGAIRSPAAICSLLALAEQYPASSLPLVVGLTGGIASGKSQVSSLFQSLGVQVIDADLIARACVAPGTAGLQTLIDHFGPDILNDQAELDRRALRQRIFADPRQRKQLESLLHPLIRQAMLEQARQLQTEPYLLFVIPLLTETGQRDLVDRVLLVDCQEQTQKQRLMTRDGLSADLAERMIASQASRAQRRQIADDILDNDDAAALATLPQQVAQLHACYLRLGAQQREQTNAANKMR
ncbi:MAG: dephospho-CoA kinase [Gammaproteobacteria bacterium]|nr:dephospho-CoA kinase [Gammaproteobacteria bacterium]